MYVLFPTSRVIKKDMLGMALYNSKVKHQRFHHFFPYEGIPYIVYARFTVSNICMMCMKDVERRMPVVTGIWTNYHSFFNCR